MTTRGVGGSTPERELSELSDRTAGIEPIRPAEYRSRIERAQERMAETGLDAIWVHAGTSLYYFTGTEWSPSERLVGAVIPANGPIAYVAPFFERGTLRDHWVIEAEIHPWHEHESPYELVGEVLAGMGIESGRVGLDETTPFFASDGLANATSGYRFESATPVIGWCRMRKSAGELALMQRAMDMTLEVQAAAARILREGIWTTEVEAFLDEAHRLVGAVGSSFVIVLFGEASAYPHGVKDPQRLERGQTVLVDTGCLLHQYQSDITRTYVFGAPTPRQREVWEVERAAQEAAFAAASLGARCGDVDVAARTVVVEAGFGPGYEVPGLPHRTGHGIGLDIHEAPFFVSSDDTRLQPGMCVSIEPMISIPGEFGVRLEDHVYLTDDGPRWFTEPAKSIDDPFG